MGDEILSTWKAIAQYLDVSVSHAKKLAKENRDFPIYRGTIVLSTKALITEWIKKRVRIKN